jgi:virulence factor Mce-like protein
MKFLKDKLILSLLGVGVVLMVCVAYLLSSVLDTPLTHRPPTVVVDLKETGGLYKGSSVTYRGVKVGKVTDITLTTQGAEAKVKLSTSLQIPTDTLAVVRSLSPVGEQYLDFQPNTDQGPFLGNNAHIPASATDVPRTLSSTVVNINKVLDQIDPDNLHKVLVALSQGLNGTGDDLGTLVDQGDAILADLQTYWPQTQSLLRNSTVALDIGTDNAANIESMATSAKQFGDFLKQYDPELRKQLEAAPGQIKTLSGLVSDIEQITPGFLQTAGSLTQIFATRDGQFRALLQNYPPGLGTLASAIHGGALNIQLLLQKDARCNYGTTREDPVHATRHPLPTNLQCNLNLPRGARAAR